MATKTLLSHVDDIDGSQAVHVGVQFGVDGVNYEIDLSQEHREELDAALAPYLEKARRTGGRKRRPEATSNGHKRPTGNPDVQAQREWARANGYTVGDKGRLPKAIVAAYKEANAPQEEPKPATRRKRATTKTPA